MAKDNMVTMQLDKETIIRLAQVSKFKLSDTEIVEIQSEFAELMHLMTLMQQIDTDEVEPMVAFQHEPFTFLREDDEKVTLSQQEVLANATQTKDGFFIVPKVINHE